MHRQGGHFTGSAMCSCLSFPPLSCVSRHITAVFFRSQGDWDRRTTARREDEELIIYVNREERGRSAAHGDACRAAEALFASSVVEMGDLYGCTVRNFCESFAKVIAVLLCKSTKEKLR